MRRLLFILALLASASMRAEDFKILFLNTENIKIGKTVRAVGDTFNDGEKIYWKDGKQAMKVISLETKKQYVLVSEDFSKRKLKSVKDFLSKSNRLSTRGIGSLSAVKAQVGDIIYWVDPVLIAIEYEPGDGEFFFLRYEGKDIPLEITDGQLVLGAKIWSGAEIASIEPDLYFHYNDGEDELVSQGILIIPLPSEIQLRKR